MGYAKVALGLPINQLFDYLAPDDCIPEYIVGARVAVPFSRHTLIGYIVGFASKSHIAKVKPITKLIDSKPILDTYFLTLTKIVSEYYCSSWGQTIESALPVGIRKGTPVTIEKDTKEVHKTKIDDSKILYYQGSSFEERLKRYSFEIEEALKNKKSVIILSPEIKLCLKIFDALKQKYPHNDIAVTYRKQKIREELRIWQDAKNGAIDILIGTRPAVFAPFSNLGLIILEEEDGYGYKEEQAPYYHAREVAALRSRLEGCKLILAGKVPTLESYYAIKTKKYQFIHSVRNIEKKAEIKIVDMKQYRFSKQGARPVISAVLDDRIGKVLVAGKRIIIFVNRKGFAHSAYCKNCGQVLECDRCSSKLILYLNEKKLICNLCGVTKDMPSLCPQCNAQYITYRGFGIERIKSQLHLAYPQAKICRIDKGHQSKPADFHILIATEMLFHTDYVPDADIVAVLDADRALNIINFRSNEKLYCLMYRLWDIAKDELLLQTRMPEYYQRKEFINFDLCKLFDLELKERKALKLPPFAHIAEINLRGKNLERTRLAALDIYERLKDKKIMLYEPNESVPLKVRGNYRYRILLKAKNPFALSEFLKKHLSAVKRSKIITTVEMDPK